MSHPDLSTQVRVREWFDTTYRTFGFRYLRPPHAYPVFLQILGAGPGARLLDVACGPGLLLRAAVERGLSAVGIDISSAAAALARDYVPEAPVLVANAESIGVVSGMFDFVTCIGSLERMFDRERALREIQRVAADDARFCFMVRNANSLSWRFWRRALRRQNHSGHQDAATLEEWTRLFSNTGFAIESILPDQWFRQRLRRLWRGKPKADRPEPIAQPILPLRYALEFIFVLRKA